MAEEKNITTYTAADIEKYWKGKLSPAEMYAMEKAAMDDPFFADALEGYQYADTADNDLNSINEKLNKRTAATAAVIPIRQKKFNWLRVAAAIIVIAGAGIFIQQLFYNNKTDQQIGVVKNQEQKKPEDVSNNAPATAGTNKDTTKIVLPETDTFKKKSELITPNNDVAISNQAITADTFKTYGYDNVFIDKKKAADNEAKQNESFLALAKEGKKGKEIIEKTASKRIADDSVVSAYKKLEAQGRTANAVEFMDRDKIGVNGLSNKYNYRVVDAQNNPVPFANVMNTRDNVGTYTDIRGNFNLLSSDSIMDVQIRSQGFVSNNYRLMPSTQQGALVLKEDENARRQITQQNRQMVASVTRKDSTEIEEPEVGWGNYNTYVQNNIKIPENIRGKKTSTDVELSFDVDKTGQPINIKVTRSSQCKECDEEAIRLLKEGPKWKRKGKKSKTTISIAVDQ